MATLRIPQRPGDRPRRDGDVRWGALLTFPGFLGCLTYPVELFQAMEQDFDPSSLANASLAVALAAILVIVAQRVVGLESLLKSK